VPISTRPASVAGVAPVASMPSCSAARQTSTGSPTGSAAAMSRSSRVAGGSGTRRRRKLSSMRPARGVASGSPKPPASSAGVCPCGSSRRARGLPRLSATIRSRTRGSSAPVTAVSSRAVASLVLSPRTTSSGSPGRRESRSDARTAKTMATGSAASRRATNSSVCTEAWSSHWASSTTQTSGRSSATSDSSVSTARPTRKRSGGAPAFSPNAVDSASCCGPGSECSRSR
jgi:hypothetical protein